MHQRWEARAKMAEKFWPCFQLWQGHLHHPGLGEAAKRYSCRKGSNQINRDTRHRRTLDSFKSFCRLGSTRPYCMLGPNKVVFPWGRFPRGSDLPTYLQTGSPKKPFRYLIRYIYRPCCCDEIFGQKLRLLFLAPLSVQKRDIQHFLHFMMF